MRAAGAFGRRFAQAREGGIALMTALTVPVLLGFAALAVDMGYAYWVRNELQVTASAAALAGASQLPDRDSVVERAQEYAGRNMAAASHGVVLREPDIELGFWDKDVRSFTPELQPHNAVRVTTRRAQENGNELDLFLAPAVGLGKVDVSGVAIATFGAATAWDVVIVQDVTNSFSGENEFPNAIEANVQLLACVRDNFVGSQVGVTTFTGHFQDIADLATVEDEENAGELEDRIEDLKTCHTNTGTPPPAGVPICSGTNISAGIAKAVALFNHPDYMPASNVVQKAIVIVSDGKPEPPTEAQNEALVRNGEEPVCTNCDLERLAQDQADIAAGQDISVYSVFFDDNDDTTAALFLESLVRGDGVFRRTPDPSELTDLLFGICADNLALRLVK